MGEDEITYSDIKEYESLFTLAPSFLLERFAKRNSNLVLKFKSTIESHLSGLTAEQKSKLDMILESEVSDLQTILHEAYLKSNKKQYEILSNPKYKKFIELNLGEIKNMVRK